MGLDMYLTGEVYVGPYVTALGTEEISRDLSSVFPFLSATEQDAGKILGGVVISVSSISFRLGYWRKANEIHAWFVDNVQDGVDECQKAYVSRDDLAELRETCNSILAAKAVGKGKQLAATLLPTRSGCFFGGTEYDEYYFQDLERTVFFVDRALALPDYVEIFYQSSW